MTIIEKIKDGILGCFALIFGIAFLATICYIGLMGLAQSHGTK